MASLSELLGETITVQDLMMRLLKTLQQFAPKLTPSQLTIDEIPLYETNLQRIIDRNNKALGLENKTVAIIATVFISIHYRIKVLELL